MDASQDDHKLKKAPSSPDRILTAREVAAYLKLTEKTVCSLAASGVLPGFKLGKAWRFDREEVLRQIAAATRGQNKS